MRVNLLAIQRRPAPESGGLGKATFIATVGCAVRLRGLAIEP
jgi:hypothetical protein